MAHRRRPSLACSRTRANPALSLLPSLIKSLILKTQMPSFFFFFFLLVRRETSAGGKTTPVQDFQPFFPSLPRSLFFFFLSLKRTVVFSLVYDIWNNRELFFFFSLSLCLSPHGSRRITESGQEFRSMSAYSRQRGVWPCGRIPASL